MPTRAPLGVLACDDARDLGEAVGKLLGIPLTPGHDTWFACGEAKYTIDANVRGADVYLFQRPLGPESDRSIYERFVMLLHAVDAARNADAARVTAVIPYFPGARQDKRKGHAREGVSTGLFARLLQAAGVSMVITVEPHNEAMAGCFDPRLCVFEAISPARAMAQYMAQNGLNHDVVASTDVGGLERARTFAEVLERDVVALSKERDYSRPNAVTRSQLIGEVNGRSVLIVDDIVDTAGSVERAIDTLWAKGATDIAVAAVHCVLSDPAWETLDRIKAKADARGVGFRVCGSSSILHANPPDYYCTFPLEPMLAEVIRLVNSRGSVRAVEVA